jgi:NAD(P)-dependent dehydrogenase (short-subunit alcohol dehydrogenase family)
MDRFNLKDEVAVVIGGTGVLGGAMAEGLADAGAKVALVGRNVKRGEARVASIQNQGGTAIFAVADAMNRASLAKAHTQIEKHLGAVTVLINAAGGNDPKATVTDKLTFQEVQLEDWTRCFDLNLVAGVLLPCQEFGPAMIKNRRGSIINIASLAAHIPLSRVPAYSAAKASVVNLTQFLAREWATKGVRVNSISPGVFLAEQNRQLLLNPDGSPSPRAQAFLHHTPMNRFGQPDELIGAVIFLASSKASSFVTGTDLRIDGGYLAQTI